MTENRTRNYRMGRRAEQQLQTRARIVDAAVELHTTLGPCRTSVTAIAEKAGVQRLTVYKHFPDDAAILQACSSHWASTHPMPEPDDLVNWVDPWERAEVALHRQYAYYRRNCAALSVLLRDAEVDPDLDVYLGDFRDQLAAMAAAVVERLDAASDPHVGATVDHCLAFGTWRSLTSRSGIDDDAAAGLAVGFLRSVRSGASA